MKRPLTIVITELPLGDLCAFEAYLRHAAFYVPTRETERQVDKRFKEQDRLRAILDRVQAELRLRTQDVV